MPLEDLLRFFHEQCKELFRDLSERARLKKLGDIDITAAEAFFIGMTSARSRKDSRSWKYSLKPPWNLRRNWTWLVRTRE